jgi:hypothetical protein
MYKLSKRHRCVRLAALVTLAAWSIGAVRAQTNSSAGTSESFVVVAGGEFKAQSDGESRLHVRLVPPPADFSTHFVSAAVKQSVAQAKLGPKAGVPFFTVRFAFPIPPANATNTVDGALAGVDPAVFTHNHSPGFEILPNGDALAVYFSTPPGKAEADPSTSFVQARLRYGSEEWDMPELFLDFKDVNDQSALLWQDGNRTWFFGGGRGVTPWMPFKIATSTDSGASWVLSLPQLDQAAANFTAQPITSAFRGSDGAIYMAMDGDGAESFLWRSADNGVHWHDMGGRTSGRHSVIVPLNDQGNLLSIGGKNSSTNGFSPMNRSSNWGKSWSAATPSSFPPLGTAQRPSMIRLTSGNLLYVGDSYLHKADKPPPADWKFGDSCFVALSTNNGASWHIKPLPVQLPGHQRKNHPTLGYVTARQAPNGVIHLLTTVTQPCLHYELNEAWIWSDAGDIAPETSGGEVKSSTEKYPNGKIRSQWSARICPNGRYLLDGTEIDFYESGAKQHEVTYVNGRKTGKEFFWLPDGVKLWNWTHDLKANRSTWVRFWPDGKQKSVSTWNTQPEARDLKRNFYGLVADGPAKQWNEDGSLKFSGNFSNGLLLGEGGR